MKTTTIFCSLFLLALFTGCREQEPEPRTDLEVATRFIHDIQQQDFKSARKLVLASDTNFQFLDQFETHYKNQPRAEQDGYREAEIIVNEVSNVADSITIVHYSNSFHKAEKNKLKLVRINGRWLVDLQYTFSGNL